ncbi:MAG: methylmalonyl Co-A mutase-associated GTPase MeaB [Bdellovibrionales bacterium]|nr:methylmalonyl Co-A mutase-associated GTPase MeaB [Bdellovibrionales bacterium]
MNVDSLVKKISAGDTTALAQAITLVESQKEEHWEKAKQLLKMLYSPKLKSNRIGFSGPPGVGKSTFIEKLGLEILNNNSKVAVLAVDPSSQMSGGSILGDKTRMEELSRHPNAFVRPSPSRGHLGGVTSTLPGVLVLCEAAGFDWILVESVGVGQSEVELSTMVDHFTLIAQPGAGDELQGIKKGILEYVDRIVVNKADLEPELVNLARQQYLAALKIMRGVDVPVDQCSALKGTGFSELFKSYDEFFSSFDFSNRELHLSQWMDSLILTQFQRRIKSDSGWNKEIEDLKQKIKAGKLLPFEAADHFLKRL